MSVTSQYTAYIRHCRAYRITPQGFARFVVDVFPYTVFSRGN